MREILIGIGISGIIAANYDFKTIIEKSLGYTVTVRCGVDISFGIDQYDKTLDGSTSTTTSYSYRV